MYEVYISWDGCINTSALICTTYSECIKHMREFLKTYSLHPKEELELCDCKTGRLVSYIL